MGEAAAPPMPASGQGRRFLLVTAPFGPFSLHLARALRSRGARCERVVLNGGDVADWGFADAVIFRGSLDEWPSWIERRLRAGQITDVVTHGDSNPYGVAALQAARRRGISTHVFEQGYLRPHWITLETAGVNANSCISRSPQDYFAHTTSAAPFVEIGRTAPTAVRYISTYHLAIYLMWPWFRRYRNPYVYSPFRQCLSHIRRYLAQRVSQPWRTRQLSAFMDRPGKLFLALLQRPGDSQLERHSPFGGAAGAFACRVIESFAAHAPKDARLLIKSHPLDHGIEAHGAHIARAAARAGVGERVLYTDDGDLQRMMTAAAALVSVNSTGGMAALERGLPTMVLGKAIYDMPGLTHQSGLDQLWVAPQAPDRRLFAAYRAALMARTQINGAFVTRAGIDLAVRGASERLLAREASPARFQARPEASSSPPVVSQVSIA